MVPETSAQHDPRDASSNALADSVHSGSGWGHTAWAVPPVDARWATTTRERRYAERLALTERLGDLGWAELDLTTGAVDGSDQLMSIIERDRRTGLVSVADLSELIEPDDLAEVRQAVVALLEERQRLDVTFRIRVPSGVRYVRALFEAQHDADGRPLRVYGIVQDVTMGELARQTRQRLAGVEWELAERQRILRAEHRMVTTLQQIILPLPSRPIERPGLRIAVRYEPAEEIARVGGDWYDVVELPHGRTLLAVGDVAGHGITAAATMARLRHTLAALAVTTTDPAELLTYLNRLVCDDPDEPTATAVVARYDPDTGTLIWAQAGHPPPILLDPGGRRVLDRPRGLIAGARRDAVYVDAETPLPAHATLLLYTDGLIERRSNQDGDWTGRVLAALAGAESEPVDRLLRRLHPANPDDDTCVLALRTMPA